ncbi:MAG: transporter substrate-binding domain-containing protein [Oscillospiraceae bacterium]|jgi:ABC-type amino acid transport substrate-binding protein
MKKLLSVILCAALILSLAALVGCNKEEKAPADTPAQAGSESAAEPAEAPAEAPAESKGTLVMGTNAQFPPYEYYEGGKIVGIDADIAQAICDKLGYELKIEDMEFDSIIPSVKSGKIDFGMAGMTVTDERLVEVDFSTSYATGVQVIIVKEDSPITSVDDLFGDQNYTIGVQLATTGDLYATWDIEDEGLGTVDRYNKGADAVMALTQGKVDCVIIDNEPAKKFVEANPGLKILDTEYALEDYAIAVQKDNSLLDELNGALEELIADGTVQSIIDKYIKA